MIGKKLFVVYLILLGLFTTYALLDTFVIEKQYAQVTAVTQADDPETEEQAEITLTTMRAFDTDIYIADIVVPDATFIRSAFANNTYGQNIAQPTLAIAQEHQAKLAINGDYYGTRPDGYVIRDGVLYRDIVRKDPREDLCVWYDGDMTVMYEEHISAADLIDSDVMHVFSFGPTLIQDGQIVVEEYSEIKVNRAPIANPRTAIAMIEPLHYLFVVADGRTEKSKGLTLYELAQVLEELEVSIAYNLDGGGSTTMVYENEVVNFPTSSGDYNERSVSDIVYVP